MNVRVNLAARRMFVSLCSVVCVAWVSPAFAEEDTIPKHLQVARDIVANVKPENNSYSNKPRYVRFPGDLFTSEYTVRTDCSGLVEAVLDKAYGLAPKFSTRKYSYAFSIIDWVDGVDRGEMFDRIESVSDLKAGDMMMWKYIIAPASNPLGLNGHILLVDGTPKRNATQRAPVMAGEGIVQWEVKLVDSAASPMSHNDTRYTKNVSAEDSNSFKLTPRNGAGRGFIYVYTDEAGKILGMAGGFSKAKINVQDVDRHMVMARVRYNELKK